MSLYAFTCRPKYSVFDYLKPNGGTTNRITDTMLVVDKAAAKQQEDTKMLREGLTEETTSLGNPLLLSTVLVLRTKERTLMNLSLAPGS